MSDLLPNESQEVSARTWRRQGCVVAVHRACPHCQAPGVWTSSEHIRNSRWSACFVDQGASLDGEPVGDKCPSCGKSRGPGLIERLGEVWNRVFG